MNDTYTETFLFQLPLPDFIITFKDTCLQAILPRLTTLIADLQSGGPNSSTLTMLSAIFLFLVIKSIAANIFTFKAPRQRFVSQQEVDNEIKLLTIEVRKMKSSLKQTIDQFSKGIPSQATNKRASGYNGEQVQKLIQLYQRASDDYNHLAEFILESQQSILKQMRMIKKAKAITEKTSSHGSRQPEIVEPEREVELKSMEQQTSDPIEEVRPVEKRAPPKPFKIPPPGGKKRAVPPPPVPR